MIVKRAAVMLTLGPLVLWLIYLGGWFMFAPLVVIMLIACGEFGRMTAELNIKFPLWLVGTNVVLHQLVALLAPADKAPIWLMATLFLGLFSALLYALRQYEHGHKNATKTLFGSIVTIIFLGWLGSHPMLLRNIDPARGSIYWQWTMVAVVATWMSDTGAYLVGSFLAGKVLGRHPLTPRLSPKKTYEGYIGGVITGTLCAALIGIFVFSLPTNTVIGLSALLAAVGTAGDLAISMLKRESGIKDSGHIFPGHGGALDRVDSLLWSIALAYYFLYFFG